MKFADGNDGSGGAVYAKDGGLTAMSVNGTYPLQVGNNTGGADSVRFRIDVNGAIDYSNAASTPTITTLNGTQVVNVLTGNFKVGNEISTLSLGGEDAYVEGTFEVDGSVNLAGTVTLSALSASSAVYTDGSSNLTTTAPTSGTIGYWSRSSTTLSPTTANDILSLATTNTTGADLGITNSGVYTGTGIVNLTANSATTGDIFNLSATGLTTGEIFNINATYAPSNGSTNEGIDINITHSPTGSADTFTGIDTQVTDGTALANTVYGANFGSINTGSSTSTKTLYGIQSSIQSSSTEGDTLVSLQAWGSVTGALTAGESRFMSVSQAIMLQQLHPQPVL